MKPMVDHHMLTVNNQDVKQETKLGLKCEYLEVKFIQNKVPSKDRPDKKNQIKQPGISITKHLYCQSCDYICQYAKELFTHEKNGCYKYKCAACTFKTSLKLVNRPGVAGAVLQSPSSLIHSFIN